MKKSANRKSANKITAYLPDDLRDFVVTKAKSPGMNWSKVIQAAVRKLKEAENASR